jgi:hypothetical protein
VVEHKPDLADRPLSELFKELANETSTLVRQEIDLAKAELSEKGKEAGKGVGFLGGAALLGLLAAGTLTACFVFALDLVMPAWAAALLVTVVYATIAAGLAILGRNRLKEASPPAPEQTIDTVKEDVRWAKAQLK